MLTLRVIFQLIRQRSDGHCTRKYNLLRNNHLDMHEIEDI